MVVGAVLSGISACRRRNDGLMLTNTSCFFRSNGVKRILAMGNGVGRDKFRRETDLELAGLTYHPTSKAKSRQRGACYISRGSPLRSTEDRRKSILQYLDRMASHRSVISHD